MVTLMKAIALRSQCEVLLILPSKSYFGYCCITGNTNGLVWLSKIHISSRNLHLIVVTKTVRIFIAVNFLYGYCIDVMM